jgi:hypothetical protein
MLVGMHAQEPSANTFVKRMQSVATPDFKKQHNIGVPKITLKLDNGKNIVTTRLKYFSNTTTGLDKGYDAGTYTDTTPSFSIDTHLVSGSTGINFTLQCLPTFNYEESVVPISIRSVANAKLTFSTVAINLPLGIHVFLEDRAVGSVTNITTNSYQIKLTTGLNGIGRFYLHTGVNPASILGQVENTMYTYNGESWAPRDPIGVSFEQDAIIVTSGDLTFENNTNYNFLTIHSGASVRVALGKTAGTSLSTTVLNSSGSSFSSLIVDGAILGSVVYNRYTAQISSEAGGTNDLISAPLEGQTFGNFAIANASNLAASGSIRAFAPFNTNVGVYQNYHIVNDINTPLIAGIGYRAATTDGSTLSFAGEVKIQDVLNLPIFDYTAGNAWNLIGNPYPSYLDFETFFNENKAQLNANGYQAIYGYNGNSNGNWTIWNAATIASANSILKIAPGQAFFVKAKDEGGFINFTEAMRSAGTSDDFIAGKQHKAPMAIFKLKLSSLEKIATTAIYFIEGTTKGLDAGYDACTYLSLAAPFAIYSELLTDNIGKAIGIQSLPYRDLVDVSIPLGINAPAETALTIGLEISSLTVPENIHVYLEDALANIRTNLKTSTYHFVPKAELKGSGRFFIRYSAKTLSNQNDSVTAIRIFNNEALGEIVIDGFLERDTTAFVYNLQGRLIQSKVLRGAQLRNTIATNHLSSGFYLVKLAYKQQIKNQKLFIQ